MFDLTNFKAIKISLASPEKIREWSHGEVTKAETINYRTLKPDRDGLFCERIFGPVKDYECSCGRYKRNNQRYNFKMVCDKCGVEVTRSSVRRERLGHIELAAPVAHIWYLKGNPCYLKLLLDMSPRAIEKVIYFAAYVVIDPGCLAEQIDDQKYVWREKQLLTEEDYQEGMLIAKKYCSEHKDAKMPKVGIGAEAIKELLLKLDLNKLSEDLKKEAANSTGQKRTNAIKRLDVIESFIKSGNRPEWVILEALPVIPPDLRPMVQLDGGRFACSDLNDLYRRVINRNNRLKKYMELRAPNIVLRNEKRMLQEAVDALIDNGRRDKRPVTGPGNRPLKSLSNLLKGKQGRFRQNLLGKRVDYSGRSVIVVGPELKMYQCGIPKEMALELFRPFVIKKLVEKGKVENVKAAKSKLERATREVWDMLEEVIKDHPVLLNRAPTLHRLGIQAFEPVLVEGRAIKLHPLVCTAYNADFDGDQMAVHVPLSIEAQAEARFLMLAANNILKPQDGRPVVSPTQDMVLGCYYLTAIREDAKGAGKIFASLNEAQLAYQTGEISLQAKIKVMLEKEVNGEKKRKLIETTVGRLIFNEAIPQDLGYVDRSDPESAFKLEVDWQVTKKDLNRIIDRCFRRHGPAKTSEVADRIKGLGFKYATLGGITIGYKDIIVPDEKKDLIKQAELKVAEIEDSFKNGLITNEERKREVIDIWKTTTEKVAAVQKTSMDKFNPIYMMAHSGARGSDSQIAQLAGMRGLMADPSGQIIEVPIKSNFREGLNVLEFFISSHGARKGLADTALRTADSGYLTRRLVDVAQDVIVREDDCFVSHNKQIMGMPITAIMDDKKVVEPFGDRILGRYTSEPVYHPETGELIVGVNELITYEIRDRIVEAGITKIECRTAFNCRTEHGVCSKCYGVNLTTGKKVDIGDAVGIIAAQAIGEPGTQLTMRTFHTGGVASAEDITQGLPRVEEIFEARKPKGQAILTEIPGTVKLDITPKKREAIITPFDGSESRVYQIPFGAKIKVEDGQTVEAGEPLTDGPINPHEILKIRGMKEVQSYMLREVQKVYRQQGVEIADKHIEIIIRQMLKKVQIEKSGDTDMLPGELVDRFRFMRVNEKVLEEDMMPAECSPKLLGITKAALATDSFLSAASFQETTRILADAAIKGKVDPLLGLKENIIIGKLIPAGLGLRRYRDVTVQHKSAPVVVPMTGDEEGFTPDDLLKSDTLPPISSYEEIMRHLSQETFSDEDKEMSTDIDTLLEDFDKLLSETEADTDDDAAASKE